MRSAKLIEQAYRATSQVFLFLRRNAKQNKKNSDILLLRAKPDRKWAFAVH